jgi:hypothetical protein
VSIFLHIVASAVAGYAIGSTIPWMHGTGKENLTISPVIPHTDYGFSIQVKF